MLSNFIIPTNQTKIAKLEISKECVRSLPCRHECKISLADGRIKEISLVTMHIYSLILATKPDKISYSGNLDHFRKAAENQSINAETVLSQIFKS